MEVLFTVPQEQHDPCRKTYRSSSFVRLMKRSVGSAVSWLSARSLGMAVSEMVA